MHGAIYLVFSRLIDMPSLDAKWQQTRDATSLYIYIYLELKFYDKKNLVGGVFPYSTTNIFGKYLLKMCNAICLYFV
jgi:hypothetical protein